jgi:hypothetical protein
MENGRTDPRYLGHGTSWRWVISFTPPVPTGQEDGRAPGAHVNDMEGPLAVQPVASHYNGYAAAALSIRSGWFYKSPNLSEQY